MFFIFLNNIYTTSRARDEFYRHYQQFPLIYHFCLSFRRTSSMEKGEINKLCRQVSIDSPNLLKQCVSNAIVAVGECPSKGARILIVYAGACYRRSREISNTSISSNPDQMMKEMSDISSVTAALAQMQASGRADTSSNSPSNCGYRDAALFPGFEVAGIIESLGADVPADCGFKKNDRVIIFPYDGLPSGYSEILCVPDLKYLVPVPDNLELSIAAMLPTGALTAWSSIISAHKIIDSVVKKRGNDKPVKLLIVGTGGLALWAVRIAAQHFNSSKEPHKHQIEVTIACLRDEGLLLAKQESESCKKLK